MKRLLMLLGLGVGCASVLNLKADEPPQPGKPQEKQSDMEVFHFLLKNREDITRTVKLIDNGVETVTSSSKAEITAKIQEHVTAMHERVKNGKGIHLRDPLFREVFKNYKKVTMKIEKTETGVKVTETSDDVYVVKLIQAHAEVVSAFIKNGHEEVRKNHPLPKKDQ